MMAERVGVSPGTYRRLEKGDPGVSLSVVAMALFSLGFGEAFATLCDPREDDQGLLLDEERLQKRIRSKRKSKKV